MELVTPGIGLIFWMTLSFSILLFIMIKFAWKPILASLKERDRKIEEALHSAEKTKEEMKKLQAGNELLLKQAREERDDILKEARKIKDSMINDAKGKAIEEGNAIIERARETINNEKMLAITEIKNQVAILSVEIAERIIREKLKEDDQQQDYLKKLIEDIKIK